MSHEVVAALRLTLPEDAREMSAKLGLIATAWSDFLVNVGPGGEVTYEVKTTRPRKPRAASIKEVVGDQDQQVIITGVAAPPVAA